MAVLKEYVCAAHGEFESRTGKCPHGCSKRFVRQEIRTAPSHTSDRTRYADSTLRGLAKDYRLPDIPSVQGGESVMMNLRKNPQFAPSWGDVTHAKPGFSERKEEAPVFTPSSMGLIGDNALSQVPLPKALPTTVRKSTDDK